jgi:hypothetical protein
MTGLQRRVSSGICLFLLISALPIAARAQRGARTVLRGLDQLTQEADVIVRGSVSSARVEPHPLLNNLTTVVVTFQVDETLKGAPRKTLQFRQYIWDIRDRLDAASYHKGEELLLLLNAPSAYGLRSPVGLEQGRFHITRNLSGKAFAVNGRGNVGLFDSTQDRAQAKGIRLSPRTSALIGATPHGPIPLDDLEQAMRNFVRVAR